MNEENENLETEYSTGVSPIVTVGTTDDGHYSVIINKNASVPEVAFCMTVIIKCFERDGVIDKEEMLDMINRYLNDPQYEEVTS
jgi:hypothetical protein